MLRTLVIRPAGPADAGAMAAMLAELGYPASPGEVPPRLEALASHPGTVALVAELEHEVVGLATCHMFPTIHRPELVAWLTALVTVERARGRGVGAALVASVESWARSHGASRLSLTSGVHRLEAHAFYEHLGYEKTGVRLAREIHLTRTGPITPPR
jgi:GNAT superfamily N-acetyltransferase